MSLLPEFLFSNKYARFNTSLQRRDTFSESVDRMLQMHNDRYPEIDTTDLSRFIKDGYVLGSQRALQFGGKPMEKNHTKGYNCSFSLCDRPEFFSQALWVLLCGTGVGFSVQQQHVAKLPPVLGPHVAEIVHVVEDSIEGWADAAKELLSSYFYGGLTPRFDFSKIRSKGTPLSHGAGKAPGAEPLIKALTNAKKILDGAIGRKLKPIEAYDITMHFADAVVSGGVRRSATLALCSYDDDEMVVAKTGDWFTANPQRARSNNSVAVLRKDFEKDMLAEIMSPSQKLMGDLGIYLTDNLDLGVNPCAEISLNPIHPVTGKTGWAFCNLTEVNAKSYVDGCFVEACYQASLLGTLQAGYTDFSYLGQVTEEIVRAEALLGVSITGIMDYPGLLADPATIRAGANMVIAANKVVAQCIGINTCARGTCIKPSGKASLLMGVSAGIHARKGVRTLRRMQANKSEAPSAFFVEHSIPEAVEPGAWGTDYCLTFAESAPEGAVTEDDLDAVAQLEAVLTMKRHWVNTGHVTGEETHNVSNTLYVGDGEWGDVADKVMHNLHDISALSFQRKASPLEWPQTPTIKACTADELEEQYGALFVALAMERWLDRPNDITLAQFSKYWDRNGNHLHQEVALFMIYETLIEYQVNIDFTELVETEDNTSLEQALACSGGSCEI